MHEVLANAERAWARLTLRRRGAAGTVTFADSRRRGGRGRRRRAGERARGRGAEAAAARGDRAGTRPPTRSSARRPRACCPTLLQADMARPERFVVGHPFNPVYLLPLVEVVRRRADVRRGDRRARPRSTRSIGMAPLRVRREVDGVRRRPAARGAVARGAVARRTTASRRSSEIDDAIRFGPGLRWALMGTFLTYRIAGGEDGMRHFMAQFGPALQWPWTKLTDVPELTDELLDTIVAQSDEQADGPVRARARAAARRLPRRGPAGAARRRRRRRRACCASTRSACSTRRAERAAGRSTSPRRCGCTRRPCAPTGSTTTAT